VDIEVSPAESAGSQRQSAEPHWRGVARRRLLGIGLGGAAASLLPAVAGRAAASTPPTSGDAGQTDNTGDNGATGDTSGVTTTAVPATTTTAAPKRPTDADVPMLRFSQNVELAAYRLYQMALATTLDDTQRTVVQVISQAHIAYGQALSGILGRLADNKTDEDLVSSRSAGFGGDSATVLEAAGALESTLVATHTAIVGKLIGTDAANLLASIVTVEARHGTVLASLGGATALGDLLVDNGADALAPAGG
jgi:Ferritin-like domain